jgi:hypothetical protein
MHPIDPSPVFAKHSITPIVKFHEAPDRLVTIFVMHPSAPVSIFFALMQRSLSIGWEKAVLAVLLAVLQRIESPPTSCIDPVRLAHDGVMSRREDANQKASGI